jgi:hypothetical protein
MRRGYWVGICLFWVIFWLVLLGTTPIGWVALGAAAASLLAIKIPVGKHHMLGGGDRHKEIY